MFIFQFFLAFYIGNIQNRIGFFVLYSIHLFSTFATINYGFVSRNQLLFTQFPFILISLIVIILLPFSTYNRNKRGQLEGQLEHANKKISELVKLEERQRIARDLHDTLGQKLSLIGLKSDLASKLITKNPTQAQIEILDVRQTARTALKEVREMVTKMRGTRLEDELFRIRQMLNAANIQFTLKGSPRLTNTTLLTENVISMCLKEAVTNIVKHSSAEACIVCIEPGRTELTIKIQDDGVGIAGEIGGFKGSGLQGMKERLEFVNGSLEISQGNGTELILKVPNTVKQPQMEVMEVNERQGGLT